MPDDNAQGEGSRTERAPLDAAALTTDLLREGGLWRDVTVVAETGSTNEDLAAEAARGAPEGAVLVAEAQTAGRGRLDRTWVSPPRAGLTFSVLLRPSAVPVSRWGWLSLLTGVSLCRAVRAVALVEARLKWPNDLLVEGRKLAGILASVSGHAAVVGVGLNVSTTPEELPDSGATSLALAGAAPVDRDHLLRAVLHQLATDYLAWRGAEGDPARSGIRAAYLEECETIGRTVSVSLPSGSAFTGTVTGLDTEGRLVLADGTAERVVAAGDVVHVR